MSLLFEVLRNTFTTWHAILRVKTSYSCREILFRFLPDLHDSNVSTRFCVSSTFLEHLSYFATIILPLLARYSNRRLRPESRERDTRRENVKKLTEEWWKERDVEVRAKNPNSSRFFFLLGPVSRCETRRGEERGGGQEKRQDTRFPSRRVILGASRFVQEPVDVPTRRQTRIDPPIAAPRAPCTNATAKPSSQSFSSAEREKGNRGRTTRKWKSAIDSWRQATVLESGYRFLRVSSFVARDFDFAR